ncbi:MAG TPA: hypothetical protein VFZ25_02505 [Chloroflexota bacterium]|nr:hypothetical protein [Chloroflexota bacterium]
MDLASGIQVFILWAHAMAAVAWVGGSLFYAVVLTPSLEEVGPTPERLSLLSVVGREFREVVRLAILVFVVTGGILIFTRLSDPRVSTAYVVVLIVKISLSLAMFWLAWRIGHTAGRGGKPAWWRRPQYLILELGVVVYFLSLLLRVLFEQTLGPVP